MKKSSYLDENTINNIMKKKLRNKILCYKDDEYPENLNLIQPNLKL